jgi:hypothetical protein
MAESRDIKYVSREFSDFRSQLVEFAKNYFPDSYNDFSPTSPGMMFIEMASYVGDVLSFYQDTQLQETFLTHAKDPKNLFNLAYMMGYKPKITGVSEASLTVTQQVSATGAGLPDFTEAKTIPSNFRFESSDSSKTRFFIPNAVNFNFSSSYDPTSITVSSVDGSNVPDAYLLSKTVKAISGVKESKVVTVGSAEKFKTITLSDDNIVQVLSIIDSDGKEYVEVPFLGQDTVFLDEQNSSSDSNQVPFVLALKKVPRRFVTRFRSNGNLDIQFGAGTLSSDDSVILPDPSTIGNVTNQGSLNYNGSGSLATTYDPSNFTYSKSYGIAPSNTNLTITYLKGGGIEANVPANSITTAVDTLPSGTFTISNNLPAAGGRDGDTVEELRENSLRAFNEQGRAVTLQDYTVRALSLPSKYGSISKVYVAQDQLTNTNLQDNIVDNNPLALSLYVLGYDNDQKLVTASSTLKDNLKTYLAEFMLITDSINIKDAFVVNIGVNYEIKIRPNYASRDVILNCNLELQEYFKISKRSINQPINLSEISVILDKVKGVQTVQKLEIVNINGGNYSEYGYDVTGATKNNTVYPSLDPCIFEIKFPNEDIKGRSII